MKSPLLIVCCLFPLVACAAPVDPSPSGDSPITEAELVRRTQALFEHADKGETAPWEQYLADDATYFDEVGTRSDKKTLIAGMHPLPAGFSGTIKVANARSLILVGTAILSYDLNETEDVFGQHLLARYHGTDTWVLRGGEWRIAAGQMFRYYEDPPAGRADPKTWPDYVGTYQLAAGKTLKIVIEGSNLYMDRGDSNRTKLLTESGDVFFRAGAEGRTLFRRKATGQVDALLSRRNNEDIVWAKID